MGRPVPQVAQQGSWSMGRVKDRATRSASGAAGWPVDVEDKFSSRREGQGPCLPDLVGAGGSPSRFIRRYEMRQRRCCRRTAWVDLGDCVNLGDNGRVAVKGGGLVRVIEAQGLEKNYRRRGDGRVRALDGLELSVPEGGVFGFLGPNGSGKTTTIRCLLGLARPSGGRCRVLGAEAPAGLPDVIDRVGALVEAPGLNPGISGRQTLAILGATAGIGRARVDAALDRVGLADRADDLVRGYSLGMRQRLGLAVALLKDPELLVLDEPANGLDPAGIRQVRELLRRLGAEGRTVFVSSHLLGEVEAVCDRVAVVARGRTVAAGSVAEVLARGRPAEMWVKVVDLAGGVDTLARAGLPSRVDGERIRVEVAPEKAESVTRALVADGHYPSELRPGETSLEDAFFALTDDLADAGGEEQR
jgi:ABC-2 type transport system ATP-binding protein